MKRLFTATLTFLAAVAIGHAGTSAKTTPDTYGTICTTIAGHNGPGTKTLTYFGLVTVEPKVYQGVITGNAATTVGDSSASFPAFPANDFYVILVSGPDAGFKSSIVSNTSTVLTLADDTSGVTATGEAYEIRPFTTLGSLFGTTLASIPINPGANIVDADNVTVIRNGGTTETFFFDNGGTQGWKDAGATLANDFAIKPEEGIIIERKVTGDVDFYTQGALLFAPIVVDLPEGFSLAGTIKTNQALTLDTSGLFTGNPATGVVDGTNPSNSDNIIIIPPNGAPTRYFRRTSPAGWFSTTLQPAGAIAIPPGSAIFILRRTGNGPLEWTVPAE